MPDEDAIEAVAMLDGHRPPGQRQTGEPGERSSDAGELGEAGRGRNGSLGQVAEAAVTKPHREDDPERGPEERQQVVVAEHGVVPALQRLRARRAAARLGAITNVARHGQHSGRAGPNMHEILVRVR